MRHKTENRKKQNIRDAPCLFPVFIDDGQNRQDESRKKIKDKKEETGHDKDEQ